MIYNCHVHIFTADSCPNDYIGLEWLGLTIKSIKNSMFRHFVCTILHYLNQFSNKDIYDKTQIFLKTIFQSQRDIYLQLKEAWPENTYFFVLTIDIRYINRGPTAITFRQQLEEVKKIERRILRNYCFCKY